MACSTCKKKSTEIQISEEIVTQNNPCNFRLRSVIGVIQLSFGSGQFISNYNLTDELAVEFLRVNPNRISMFSVYPENLEELLHTNNIVEKDNEK